MAEQPDQSTQPQPFEPIKIAPPEPEMDRHSGYNYVPSKTLDTPGHEGKLQQAVTRAEEMLGRPLHAQVVDCRHTTSTANVRVAAISDERRPDGRIIGYQAEIVIHCAACGIPFRFDGPSPFTLSIADNGCTIRLPITPQQ